MINDVIKSFKQTNPSFYVNSILDLGTYYVVNLQKNSSNPENFILDNLYKMDKKTKKVESFVIDDDRKAYLNALKNPLYLKNRDDSKMELKHYGTPRHSGRYPWGSGKRPKQRLERSKDEDDDFIVSGSQGGKIHQFFSKRVGRKRMNDYINSPEFVRGDYSGYVGKNVTALMKTKSRTMDNYSGPNWTYGRRDQEVTFKKPKPRLTAGSSEVNKTAAEQKSSNKKKYDSPELNKTTPKQKTSNKKKYDSPSFAKSMDQKAATEALKADTEYRKALAENETLRHPKTSSADLAKAAGHFKGAASSMESVSKGVSNAWDDLHNAKYRNKDRSKEVKDLSNAELQNVIARIKLEQEYNRITMPQKKSGYDKTMAALSVIGTAATITATGLSIAAGVKALKKQ